MDNKLILNLRMEVGDPKMNISLMALVLRKLRQLREAGIEVEYFELRLQMVDQKAKQKAAYIKIDANDRTFIDSEVSSRWDKAILNPYERLKGRFLECLNSPLSRSIA